ncbi:hypothetical protein [Burkholderia sp. 3C]
MSPPPFSKGGFSPNDGSGFFSWIAAHRLPIAQGCVDNRRFVCPLAKISFIILGFPHSCPRRRIRESLHSAQSATKSKQEKNKGSSHYFWIDHEDVFRKSP